MATIESVPVALLVEDTELYPRESIDDIHVADLAHALRSGTELPALIIDNKTSRIVDGVHRARAHRRVNGDEAMVPVERRNYKNDAEMFEDAIKLNAGHGRKLQRIDQIRIIIKARDLGISDIRTAAALHIPQERVEALAVRVATSDGRQIPLKGGFEHLAGRTISPEQAAEHKKQRAGLVMRLASELYGRVLQNLDDLSLLPDKDKEKLLSLARLLIEKLDVED